jgi:hypothetical protein
MSSNNDGSQWLREFEQFLRVEDVAPPGAVASRIRAHVRGELHPAVRLVAAKLFAMHALAAGLVSLFCPQLGVGPVLASGHIFHWLERYGSLPCAAVCGALFLGAGSLFSVVVLSRPELRVAARHRVLGVTFLAAVGFAGLMLVGGQGDRLAYLGWLLGAFSGGWLVMRAGAAVRLQPA